MYLNFLSGDEMDIHEFQVGENSAYGALYPILHGCPGLLLVDDISLKGDDDDDNATPRAAHILMGTLVPGALLW